MKRATKGKVVNASAKALAITAPIVAAATQFPIWVEKGGDTTASGIALSGGFLAIAIISFVPALKGLKEKLKNPGAFVLWGLLFAIIWGLYPIMDELRVITAVGFASNGGSFILGKVGNYLLDKGDKQGADIIGEYLKKQKQEG